MSTKVNKIIEKINSVSQGFDVYVVGGFPRDLILKRKFNDIDLVVDKNIMEYSRKVAGAFDSKVVVLNNLDKTYRIVLKNAVFTNIDISSFAGKTIEQDLQSRDFTINAVGFNLKDFKNFEQDIVLSSKNILKDFKLKTINTVSSESFEADPLRMLRAFRFAAELSFKISKNTFKLIKQYAKHIRRISPERIKNEFFRVLSSKNASFLIKNMDDCKLLSEVFPEIEDMKKSHRKHYYHHGGLFQHSFETMEAAENILNSLKKYFPQNYVDLKNHFSDNAVFSENITRAGLLKFAALFHDSAKLETANFYNGKIHFLGHEKEGAKKVGEIMLSLKFGRNDVDMVMFLISNHMRPSSLTKNDVITKRAALKFFRSSRDSTPELLILAMSDWHSYKKLKVFPTKELKSQEESVRELLKSYFNFKNAKPLSKIIDGNVIMESFALKPGPWIGELLKFAFEAQQEGKISTKEGALKILLKKIRGC
jgi:poly(A) polymerase